MTRKLHGSPLQAVEVSLRRLRLVGAVIILGASFTQRGEAASHGTFVAAAVLGLSLLVANAASKRMTESGRSQTRLVWIQLVLDIVVTTGTIITFAPDPSSMAWVIIGLPVLEGAMRYRMLGVIGAWLTIVTALCVRVIVTWKPGSGFEPFLELAQPVSLGLALGVPAGYLAERLTAELDHAVGQNEDAQRRSRLLAVLTIAGQDFTRLSQREVMKTAVEAAKELGYEYVDIGVFDLLSGNWGPTFIQSDSEATVPMATDVELLAAQPDSNRYRALEGRLVGVIAQHGAQVLMLRAFDPKDKPGWPPRDEAFSVLATNASSAMAAAIRQERLTAAQRQLQHDSTHDQLTGLLNRAGLLADLERSLRPNDDRTLSCAVLFLDLDGFKLVNDTYGHDAGDAVLKEIALRLRTQLPDGASIARMGGDEFVVVLPGMTESAVLDLREQIDRVVVAPMTVAGQPMTVGTSTGIHIVEDKAMTPEQAIHAADAEMYIRKRSTQRASLKKQRIELTQISPQTEHAQIPSR